LAGDKPEGGSYLHFQCINRNLGLARESAGSSNSKNKEKPTCSQLSDKAKELQVQLSEFMD